MRPDETKKTSAFQQAGIRCAGHRPWLGDNSAEVCDEALVGALINQTNLYFAKTVSAILLPDVNRTDEKTAQVRSAIESEPSICGVAKTLWKMNNKQAAIGMVRGALEERHLNFSSEEIDAGLNSLFDPTSSVASGVPSPADPESRFLTFRREEFNIIRNEVNDPVRIPNLRVISTQVPDDLSDLLDRVNLVERLRETRAFYGFDRLEQKPQTINEMPESAMSQLFLYPPDAAQDRWLPAIEVFGEGIYLELNDSSLTKWQRENKNWLDSRLDEQFLLRLGGEQRTLAPLGPASRTWASKYLLVHSFAHLLINQLVFECGYSSAALRERLYISADPAAPMAGILVYTAAGDAEGTLGGLVRLGRPERLSAVIRRAISRASWCSADPVCSEDLGGQGSRLANLAACHACVLLPETSCETINHGLDRSMVVGTPDNRSVGFMARLLEEAYTLA